LRDVLVINPSTKVFIGAGYYDTDIPYFVTQTAVNQLFLPKSIRNNIQVHYYNGGHMFYFASGTREQLSKDIAAFYGKKN